MGKTSSESRGTVVQAQAGRMSSLPGVVRDVSGARWVVSTPEGMQSIRPGDWLITDGNSVTHLLLQEAFLEVLAAFCQARSTKAPDALGAVSSQPRQARGPAPRPVLPQQASRAGMGGYMVPAVTFEDGMAISRELDTAPEVIGQLIEAWQDEDVPALKRHIVCLQALLARIESHARDMAWEALPDA